MPSHRFERACQIYLMRMRRRKARAACNVCKLIINSDDAYIAVSRIQVRRTQDKKRATMKKAFLVVFVAILLEQTPVQADSSGSMF